MLLEKKTQTETSAKKNESLKADDLIGHNFKPQCSFVVTR